MAKRTVHINIKDSSLRAWAALGDVGRNTAETVLRSFLPGSVEVHINPQQVLARSAVRGRDADELIGQIVRFKRAGLNGPQREAGTVKQALPDGRYEIKSQHGGYYKLSRSEFQTRSEWSGTNDCGCSGSYDAAQFSSSMIERLRSEYSTITSVDPAGESYRNLTALLNGLSQEQLKQLAAAGIKFVSGLARNRVTRDGVLRLVDKVVGVKSIVRVYYDDDLDGEYICQLFVNGKHNEAADYYTDSKSDAVGTAREMVRHADANTRDAQRREFDNYSSWQREVSRLYPNNWTQSPSSGGINAYKKSDGLRIGEWYGSGQYSGGYVTVPE